MKKTIIYTTVGAIFAVFILYNSIYFMSLSERNKQIKAQKFDPTDAVNTFWEDVNAQKIENEAVDVADFREQLSDNPQDLIKTKGKTLGIGAPYSVLIKGKARIKEVDEEFIKLDIDDVTDYVIRIKYIFTNTVREASGYFNLDEFETTMDFNLVAIEINNRIIQQTVAPVASQLLPNTYIEFVGAVDLNPNKQAAKSLEIIPINLNIEKHEE